MSRLGDKLDRKVGGLLRVAPHKNNSRSAFLVEAISRKAAEGAESRFPCVCTGTVTYSNVLVLVGVLEFEQL